MGLWARLRSAWGLAILRSKNHLGQNKREQMISFDLSKAPSLRFFVYLLALFPGLFFLLSVAVGNPQLAKTTIQQIAAVYSFPPYGLLLILVGSGFVIGQGIVLLSWLIEMILANAYRAPGAAFRKLFGAQWLYRWFGKHQGIPPNPSFVIRTLGKLIFLARAGELDPLDARAVRWCLAAAAEKLLERRYGIDPHRANGPNGGEWQVWYSVLGKPIKSLSESQNAGRTTLACGVSGYLSLSIAPQLIERYYISLCSMFVFAGLWTAGQHFFLARNPIRLDVLRLRSVLLELQDCSPSEPKAEIAGDE